MKTSPASESVDDDVTTKVFIHRAILPAQPDRPPEREYPSQRPTRDPEMLTVKEAADLLRVNVKTVYMQLATGRLPHVMLGKRIIRIPRSVIASLTSKFA